MASRRVDKLKAIEARAHFLKPVSYTSIAFPPYINFDQLLVFTASTIGSKELKDICKVSEEGKPLWPKNYQGVNYTLLSNKDGAYSWRPMQLIHPVLYIDLVNTITNIKNWKQITDRFEDFSKAHVKCISIPRESLSVESDTASQISHWWENIEQQSIRKSLEFDYVFTTDITDCYGSIYTHSLEWALHKDGKEGVKQDRKDHIRGNQLGEAIDTKLRNMNYGQTNGIPQGSVLMDFIAEIILGYADIELSHRLDALGIKQNEYYILRYRDDYRILTNNPPTGHEIL